MLLVSALPDACTRSRISGMQWQSVIYSSEIADLPGLSCSKPAQNGYGHTLCAQPTHNALMLVPTDHLTFFSLPSLRPFCPSSRLPSFPFPSHPSVVAFTGILSLSSECSSKDLAQAHTILAPGASEGISEKRLLRHFLGSGEFVDTRVNSRRLDLFPRGTAVGSHLL